MTLAVEARDLRRTFRTHTGVVRRARKDVDAVKGVTFDIAPGELFGLLGPNGAGKTTTIKMLITLLLPTGGSARVLGRDVVEDVREVRRRIGYVFGGDRGLYERLSGVGVPAVPAGRQPPLRSFLAPGGQSHPPTGGPRRNAMRGARPNALAGAGDVDWAAPAGRG